MLNVQDQRQELVQSLYSLLEPADLLAAKALVALGLICKADCNLLGAVVQPQLLQHVSLCSPVLDCITWFTGC